MNYPKVIAVDFDGCLCERKWPGIGAANWDAIHALIRRKATKSYYGPAATEKCCKTQ